MEEVEEEEEEATHLHFRWTPLRRKDQAKGEEECKSLSSEIITPLNLIT